MFFSLRFVSWEAPLWIMASTCNQRFYKCQHNFIYVFTIWFSLFWNRVCACVRCISFQPFFFVCLTIKHLDAIAFWYWFDEEIFTKLNNRLKMIVQIVYVLSSVKILHMHQIFYLCLVRDSVYVRGNLFFPLSITSYSCLCIQYTVIVAPTQSQSYLWHCLF